MSAGIRLSLSIAVAAIVLAVAVFFLDEQVAADDPAFDSAAWRAGALDVSPDNFSSSDNPRYHLAGALMEEHLQPGMPRHDVLELLGPPDSVQDGSLHYVIGTNPYHIDPDAVVISFDDDHRLVESRIVQY